MFKKCRCSMCGNEIIYNGYKCLDGIICTKCFLGTGLEADYIKQMKVEDIKKFVKCEYETEYNGVSNNNDNATKVAKSKAKFAKFYSVCWLLFSSFMICFAYDQYQLTFPQSIGTCLGEIGVLLIPAILMYRKKYVYIKKNFKFILMGITIIPIGISIFTNANIGEIILREDYPVYVVEQKMEEEKRKEELKVLEEEQRLANEKRQEELKAQEEERKRQEEEQKRKEEEFYAQFDWYNDKFGLKWGETRNNYGIVEISGALVAFKKDYAYLQISIGLYKNDVKVGTAFANINNLSKGTTWGFIASGVANVNEGVTYKLEEIEGW